MGQGNSKKSDPTRRFTKSEEEKGEAVGSEVLKRVKITVLGDSGVGKTCLLASHLEGENFAKEGIQPPAVWDYARREDRIGEMVVEVIYWDTALFPGKTRLHPVCYAETDLFVLCFAVDNRLSFENIKEKWHPDVLRNGPRHASCMVVGLKTDLRDRSDDEPKADYREIHLDESGEEDILTADDGRLLARGHALHYMECSALRGEGVSEMFDAAICLAAGMPMISRGLTVKSAKR